MQYVDLSSILLEGYLPKGEPVRSKSGEKEFVTVSYKGIHSNEYVIFEIKNDQYDGTAELYDEGVLKMRWSMHNGDREGSFVLYEDGVASREGRWDDLNDDTEVMTWIEDSEDGLRMAITHNNQLVYRGGFNDTYQRDGFGVEFSDGQPTQTGEFVDGTLVHIYQRVVNSSKMIEFGGRGNENNLSIPSRRPIYIGGFSYNAERNRLFPERSRKPARRFDRCLRGHHRMDRWCRGPFLQTGGDTASAREPRECSATRGNPSPTGDGIGPIDGRRSQYFRQLLEYRRFERAGVQRLAAIEASLRGGREFHPSEAFHRPRPAAAGVCGNWQK